MSDDVRLDPIQRHILANQYRILNLLEPKAGWDTKLEAVEHGYEIEYELEDSGTLSADEAREIYDILDMFVVLKTSMAKLSEADRKKVDDVGLTFRGFDGNNEPRHLSYLGHLWKTHRWTDLKSETRDGGNSHMQTLAEYRGRLGEYRKSADRHALTLDDLIRIAKV